MEHVWAADVFVSPWLCKRTPKCSFLFLNMPPHTYILWFFLHDFIVTKISCFENSIFSFLQWSLTTAWEMKTWSFGAATQPSVYEWMGLSSPREMEQAWMNQSSLNLRQLVRTNKSGRLWSSWHLLTNHYLNKVKMRWVTHMHTDVMLQFSIIITEFLLPSHFLQWSGDGNSTESGQNSLGFQREREK